MAIVQKNDIVLWYNEVIVFTHNKFSEEKALSENIEIKEDIITVSGLKKQNGNVSVLDGIDLSFTKKGIHCILGPVGSGKTALLDVLSLSVPFDGGSVVIGGNAVLPADGEKKLNPIKKRMSYVRRYGDFYSDMTVFEVMSFVGDVKKVASAKRYRQIKEALELVELDEMSGKLVKDLSTQENRLLGLAAALIGNPDIIFVDEPNMTKNSQDKCSLIFSEVLKMLGKRKTVIFATEYYDVARELCDDVVILSDGQILASGTFEALEERSAAGKTTLKALYESLSKTSKYSGYDNLFGSEKSVERKNGGK